MDSSSFDNEKEIRSEQVNDDPSFSAEQERRLVRKFDFRLLPFLSFMYLFSSLDRSSVGMLFLILFDTRITQLLNLLSTLTQVMLCWITLSRTLE